MTAIPTGNRDDEIQIYDLHKSFGEVEVLKGISLTVHRGEVVCVIGPSGSGKSTLLRCVNMLEQPTSGQIYIINEEITDLDADVDLYVSFDNLRVGELQARYLLEHLPTPGRGRIVRIFGAKTDNNAALFKTTDIIETSVYRMIVSQNNFTSSTAVGLYQSLFGFALIMIVNWIVRRINEEYALF